MKKLIVYPLLVSLVSGCATTHTPMATHVDRKDCAKPTNASVWNTCLAKGMVKGKPVKVPDSGDVRAVKTVGYIILGTLAVVGAVALAAREPGHRHPPPPPRR